MAYDLDRTTYSTTLERPFVPGTTVAAEGLVLKSVLVGGVENVQVTAGGVATEVIVGFSHNRAINPTTQVVIEDTLVIPAAPGPYVVQLQHTNLVSGSVLVWDVAGAVAMTLGSSGSTDHASVNLSLGQITFYSGDAAKAIVVTYVYQLTAIQAQQTFWQAPINTPNPAYNGNVVVLCGNGEMWTDQYDTSVSYVSVSALYAGANGIVTSTQGSNTLIPGSRIVSVPSSSNTYLGFRFNLA
jgi:hypothetical protein